MLSQLYWTSPEISSGHWRPVSVFGCLSESPFFLLTLSSLYWLLVFQDKTFYILFYLFSDHFILSPMGFPSENFVAGTTLWQALSPPLSPTNPRTAQREKRKQICLPSQDPGRKQYCLQAPPNLFRKGLATPPHAARTGGLSMRTAAYQTANCLQKTSWVWVEKGRGKCPAANGKTWANHDPAERLLQRKAPAPCGAWSLCLCML